MRKVSRLHQIFKKTLVSVICMVEMLVVIGSMSACGVSVGNAASQQENAVTNESQQTTATNAASLEATPSSETQQTGAPSNENQQAAPLTKLQQDTVPSDTAQQNTAQPNTTQQNTAQPTQPGNGQISLDDAKQAALTDAGISASDAQYTKEKLDYEDGTAVYEIEFYAGNTQYEYEINAATGAVYSKSVETFPEQASNGNKTGTSTTYIDVDNAKSIALNHAGFSEADVSRFKSEFDIDDGWAVYEIEFNKGGREYEYKINATDGSIIEYDVD